MRRRPRQGGGLTGGETDLHRPPEPRVPKKCGGLHAQTRSAHSLIAPGTIITIIIIIIIVINTTIIIIIVVIVVFVVVVTLL